MKTLWLLIRFLFCLLLTVLALSEGSAFAAPQAPAVYGSEVYQRRCASCHDQPGSPPPTKEALQKLTATQIRRSLDFGMMMGVAGPMKREDREAVATFLGT